MLRVIMALVAGGQEPVPPAALPAPPPAPPPATVVTGVDAVVAPSAPAPPVIVGGWQSLAATSPELRPVLAAAVRHLTPARHARGRLLDAERQVVAGMNYRLLVQLRDGSRWRVTVWRRLDRTLQVAASVREN